MESDYDTEMDYSVEGLMRAGQKKVREFVRNMIATATFTAAELHTEDSERGRDLRAFLAFWEKYRRCPLEFVDWLMEHDAPPDMVAGARWAATAPWRTRAGQSERERGRGWIAASCPHTNPQREF